MNDIHAHFDEMSDMNARCTEELSEAGKVAVQIAQTMLDAYMLNIA